MRMMDMGFIEYKLSELGEIITGKTPPKTNAENYNSKDVLFIKPDDISVEKINRISKGKSYVSEKGAETGRLVGKGTILVTCIGIVGKIGIVECERAIFNQQINAIIPNEKIVLGKYLAYLLYSMQRQLQDKANAPIVPILNKTNFSGIKVRIPSLTYQEKVIDLLDGSQTLIQKRQSQITALDELTQSVFLEMFGDPAFNERYKEVELAQVLKNKAINGFFAKNEEYSSEGNAEVIWISNFINKNEVELKSLKKVNASKKDIDKYKVNYGDLLFCRSSLTAEGIGKCAYVPEYTEHRNVLFECHIIKTSLDIDMVIPEFIQSISMLPYFRNQVIKNSKTSTMTTISQDGITNCKIICPSIDEQLKFKAKIHSIWKQKETFLKTLNYYEQLYNALLQKAFKGELFQEQV